MIMQTREQMLLDLERKAYLDAIAQARAEGFRLCREMASAAIIDAADMNGQVYAMRAAAKVRALKVEGETP